MDPMNTKVTIKATIKEAMVTMMVPLLHGATT